MTAAPQSPSPGARQGAHPERSLCAPRLVLGTAYLTWSALAARHRSGPAALRAVAGILGVRHIAQALLTAGRARAVIALGAEADAAHCASMIMLGSLSGRWRPAAFADALLAGSFASAGVACARRLPAGEAAGIKAGTLRGWRDRCADLLARHLAPSWLRGARLPVKPARPNTPVQHPRIPLGNSVTERGVT